MYTRWSPFLFRNVVATEGVIDFAEEHGAYWLLDAIASYQPELQLDPMLKEIQFWELTVKPDSATLVCRKDSGYKPTVTQVFEFTDFPHSQKFFVARGDGFYVIMLPSEY